MVARFLNAADVARMYGIDMKTLHNWVNAEKIKAARTPGRHLRFAPSVVLADMRKYYLPEMIPNELIAMVAADEQHAYQAAMAAATFLEKRSIDVPEELRALIRNMTPSNDDIRTAVVATTPLKAS